MMEAAVTSETSVNFRQTALRNNPEDSLLLVFFFSLNTLNLYKDVSVFEIV
jgi:hypothetical protein